MPSAVRKAWRPELGLTLFLQQSLQSCHETLGGDIRGFAVAADRILEVGSAVGAKGDLLTEGLPAIAFVDRRLALQAEGAASAARVNPELHPVVPSPPSDDRQFIAHRSGREARRGRHRRADQKARKRPRMRAGIDSIMRAWLAMSKTC